MEMTDLVEGAKRQLADVTGLKPVGAAGASRDDGGWHVRVDMLEMARIPPASDVLGEYEAVLGGDGTLLSFQRRRTRLRGEPMEEELEG